MLFWLQSAIMLKSVGEDFGNLQMTDLEKRITSCLLHHTQTGVHPSVSHVHLHLCNVYTASSAKRMWTIGHDDWSWEGKMLITFRPLASLSSFKYVHCLITFLQSSMCPQCGLHSFLSRVNGEVTDLEKTGSCLLSSSSHSNVRRADLLQAGPGSFAPSLAS